VTEKGKGSPWPKNLLISQKKWRGREKRKGKSLIFEKENGFIWPKKAGLHDG